MGFVIDPALYCDRDWQAAIFNHHPRHPAHLTRAKYPCAFNEQALAALVNLAMLVGVVGTLPAQASCIVCSP
jgi:hypothetical protein